MITEFITLPIIFSGLIAAITWNLLTWWLGIPSSSSHTLIGGFAGAAIAKWASFSVIKVPVIVKIASFIFIAPLVGMVVAMILTIVLQWSVKRVNPHKANTWFKHFQLVSSALLSIGHGLNDSQKVMGIIAAALIATHIQHPEIGFGIESISDLPNWVAFSCFFAISLGTMSGGWKIVKTMGTRITKVTPFEGVVAETAGALTLYFSEFLKIPVSTGCSLGSHPTTAYCVDINYPCQCTDCCRRLFYGREAALFLKDINTPPSLPDKYSQ